MEEFKNVLIKLTEVVREQAQFHHDDMIEIIGTLESMSLRVALLETKVEEALAKIGGK